MARMESSPTSIGVAAFPSSPPSLKDLTVKISPNLRMKHRDVRANLEEVAKGCQTGGNRTGIVRKICCRRSGNGSLSSVKQSCSCAGNTHTHTHTKNIQETIQLKTRTLHSAYSLSRCKGVAKSREVIDVEMVIEMS
jgi:hypothetical protein